MRQCCLGAVVFLFVASTAFGDGCYFPQRAVQKIPAITGQRAILSWKDGVETLVIESALDSESQSLGWIVPLPAVPDKMEKATPGTVKTLDFCIQPSIVHDLSHEVWTVFLAVLVGNLLVGTWVFKKSRFGDLLALLLLLFILYGLLLPAVNMAGTAARASSMHIEQSATVGSYAVSVLRPSHSGGLNPWLAENGFAELPEAAKPIVADYVSQGWVFAAIKLTRGESGANAPHPIRLTFPSKEPVYPMKLTALAGGKPGFDLFVIADDRASCDMLPEEFCDRFSMEKGERGDDETHEWLSGKNSGCEIGHPAIVPLMWDGCVLTKFAGKLDAADMTKDIRFARKSFKTHQDRYFTEYGAGCAAAMLFALVASIGNILFMRDYAKGRVQPPGLASYCIRRLLPAIFASEIVAVACYFALPKLANGDVQLMSGGAYYWSGQSLGRELENQLTEHREILSKPELSIAEYLRQAVSPAPRKSPWNQNRLTGEALRVEDSPGNFTVEKQADKVIIRSYDRTGSAVTRTIPTDAKSTSGQAGL